VFEIVDGNPSHPPGDFPRISYRPCSRFAPISATNGCSTTGAGFGTARLLAFDLATSALVHRRLPGKIALLGSMLNDFQVSPDGKQIYIADASLFALIPAIVVYDVSTQKSRRLLEGHESVLAEDYAPVVQGQRMEFYGLFTVRPGVDSIALDDAGEWLYFAPFTNKHLYRVRPPTCTARACPGASSEARRALRREDRERRHRDRRAGTLSLRPRALRGGRPPVRTAGYRRLRRTKRLRWPTASRSPRRLAVPDVQRAAPGDPEEPHDEIGARALSDLALAASTARRRANRCATPFAFERGDRLVVEAEDARPARAVVRSRS
jgi:hypothetical protein